MVLAASDFYRFGFQVEFSGDFKQSATQIWIEYFAGQTPATLCLIPEEFRGGHFEPPVPSPSRAKTPTQRPTIQRVPGNARRRRPGRGASR